MNIVPRVGGFILHGDDPPSHRAEYLIGNFLPMKGVGLLVGKSKVGKTFLVIGMGASTASGSPFLSHYIPASGQVGRLPRRIEGGSTLIIAGEGLDSLPARLDAAYQGLGEEYRQRLADLGCTGHLPVYRFYRQGLRDDAAFERLYDDVCELAGQLDIFAPCLPLRLIVIDTGPAVFSFKDENSAAEIQGMYCKLVRLSEATGAVIVVTMHPAKHTKNGTVRGSGVFEGSADFILSATNGANGLRKLTVTKSRSNAAEGESWGYRLAPIVLPNGELCAYADGLLRTIIPPPMAEQAPEGERMTRDGTDVLAALRDAASRKSVTWQLLNGHTIYGADEKEIQTQLACIKPGASADTRRKSYARGVERLRREGVIDQRRHDDGRTVYWVVGDNTIGSDDSGGG